MLQSLIKIQSCSPDVNSSFAIGARDGTRFCYANPASSSTQCYAFGTRLRTSKLKTVHRTVFLTLLTLLGFKSLLCVLFLVSTKQKTRSFDLVWCERRDLNPYELPHTPLKRARLPIPPLSHIHFTLSSARILYHFEKLLSILFLIFFQIFCTRRVSGFCGERGGLMRAHANAYKCMPI